MSSLSSSRSAATPSSHPRAGWREQGALLAFILITLAFAGLATWANTDLTGPRPFLFMDEMIPYDGVKGILTAGSWKQFVWAVLDGGDHRYGRIFYNVSALFSALPYLFFGDKGLVISIRSVQAVFLLSANILLCCSLLKTWTARALGMFMLCCLPFTAYYLTAPKPEPLQLLLFAIFLALAVKRRFSLGTHWIFLGLAFGAKISAAPLCFAAGLAGLGAAWLDGAPASKTVRQMMLAAGCFLLGWLVAVPILAWPTGEHINTYLHWTFRSTTHPWDNASVDAAAWFQSMLNGTDAFKYYLPRNSVVPLFIALATFVAWHGFTEIWQRRNWRASWGDYWAWIVLAFAAFLLLPIIFAVKRIWGFYLHPGETLGLVAVMAMGEAAWLKPLPSALFARITRVLACLVLAAGLYVIYQSKPALHRDYQTLAERSLAPMHVRNAETYLEILARLRLFAAAQKNTAGADNTTRVYYDPFLYLPESEPGLRIQPFWQPFNYWEQRYEVIVMGWEQNLSYYTGAKPLPPDTSARFKDLVQARDQFLTQVAVGKPDSPSRTYRLAGWIRRDAAILVRADLIEAWNISTQNLKALSPEPATD